MSGDDRLGKLKLTADGVRRRNEAVYRAVLDEHHSSTAPAARSSSATRGRTGGSTQPTTTTTTTTTTTQTGRTRSPRLVVCMGGGYPKDLDPHSAPFRKIVDHHVGVYVGAAQASARQWRRQ